METLRALARERLGLTAQAETKDLHLSTPVGAEIDDPSQIIHDDVLIVSSDSSQPSQPPQAPSEPSPQSSQPPSQPPLSPSSPSISFFQQTQQQHSHL